ncbi:hypothetical protein EC968_010633 [Mortierella alpina]|nr:hypothetical protein EC968_010633 [Mortierella alpina]
MLNPLLILIPVVLTVVVLVTVLLSVVPSHPKVPTVPTVVVPTPTISVPIAIPTLPLKVVAPVIQPLDTSDELSSTDPEEVSVDDVDEHDEESGGRDKLHHDTTHHEKVQKNDHDDASDIDTQEERPNFEFKTPFKSEDTQDVHTKAHPDELQVLEKREIEADNDFKQNEGDDAPIYKAENVGNYALEHLIQEIVGLQSAVVEKNLFKIIPDLFESDEGAKFQDFIRDLAFNHFSKQQYQESSKDQVQAAFSAQETSITSGFIDMLVQPFIAQVKKAIRGILASVCNGVADAESVREVSDPDIIPEVFACLKGNLDKFMLQVGALLAGRLGEARQPLVKQLMKLTTSLPLPQMPLPEASTDEKKVVDESGGPLVEQSVDSSAEEMDANDEDEDLWTDESMETTESDNPQQEAFVNWLIDKVLEGLKTATANKGVESNEHTDDVQPLRVAEQAH